MKRIVLEVDEEVAEAWRYSSEKKKMQVNATISKILKSAFSHKQDDDFIEFVKDVQNKAAERGLTEDILNDILNEKG